VPTPIKKGIEESLKKGTLSEVGDALLTNKKAFHIKKLTIYGGLRYIPRLLLDFCALATANVW